MGRDRAGSDGDGRVKSVDAREVRLSLKMTQTDFAERFKIDLATLRSWEQGRALPTGAARTLLMVISRDPGMVERALQAAS